MAHRVILAMSPDCVDFVQNLRDEEYEIQGVIEKLMKEFSHFSRINVQDVLREALGKLTRWRGQRKSLLEHIKMFNSARRTNVKHRPTSLPGDLLADLLIHGIRLNDHASSMKMMLKNASDEAEEGTKLGKVISILRKSVAKVEKASEHRGDVVAANAIQHDQSPARSKIYLVNGINKGGASLRERRKIEVRAGDATNRVSR